MPKGRRFAYLVEFADTANLVAVEAGAIGFGVKSGQLYHKSPAGVESLIYNSGNLNIGGFVPYTGATGKVTFFTPTTAQASIRLPHGVLPTTLENGDVWTTVDAMFLRRSGTTRIIPDTGHISTSRYWRMDATGAPVISSIIDDGTHVGVGDAIEGVNFTIKQSLSEGLRITNDSRTNYPSPVITTRYYNQDMHLNYRLFTLRSYLNSSEYSVFRSDYDALINRSYFRFETWTGLALATVLTVGDIITSHIWHTFSSGVGMTALTDKSEDTNYSRVLVSNSTGTIAYAAKSGFGNLSGTLTENYIPVATGANTLGNSLVYSNSAANAVDSFVIQRKSDSFPVFTVDTLSDTRYARIGINCNSESAALHVRTFTLSGTAGAGTTSIQETISENVGGAALLFRKSRGWLNNQQPCLANDVMGGITGQAYNGSSGNGYSSVIGRIRLVIESRQGESAPYTYSTYWHFDTAVNSTQTEKMRLTAAGFLGINTTTPTERLHVGGNARVDGTLKVVNTNKRIEINRDELSADWYRLDENVNGTVFGVMRFFGITNSIGNDGIRAADILFRKTAAWTGSLGTVSIPWEIDIRKHNGDTPETWSSIFKLASSGVLTLPAFAGSGNRNIGVDEYGKLIELAISGGTPAGSDCQIQYNISSAFAASANFVYDPDYYKFSVISTNNSRPATFILHNSNIHTNYGGYSDGYYVSEKVWLGSETKGLLIETGLDVKSGVGVHTRTTFNCSVLGLNIGHERGNILVLDGKANNVELPFGNLSLGGVTFTGVTGRADVSGNVSIPNGYQYYLGDNDTNGSWRTRRIDASNFSVEVRDGGSWLNYLNINRDGIKTVGSQASFDLLEVVTGTMGANPAHKIRFKYNGVTYEISAKQV